MRAMIFREQGKPLSYEDAPTPTPGPDQVLLRVQVCGVCRTDLHIVDGELTEPKFPLIPGHQIIGIVAATGPKSHPVLEGRSRRRPLARINLQSLSLLPDRP